SRRKPVPVRSAVSRHGDTARSARRRADNAADPTETRRRRPDEPEVPVLPVERPDPRGVDPAPARPDGGCPVPRRGGDPDPNGRGPADARLRAAYGGPRPRLPAIGPGTTGGGGQGRGRRGLEAGDRGPPDDPRAARPGDFPAGLLPRG